MSEWIDLLVYAAFMLILWFALPAANARFTLPVIEDRNREWLAAHPELARRVASGRWFRAAASLLGAASIAVLVAVQVGAWPAAWSAPAFEPERWMVLSNVFTALAMLWLVFFAAGAMIFQRWLTRAVPLADHRQASLEPRSVSTYTPRTLRAVVYGAVGVHLAAWVAVGVLGRYSSDAFWWNVAFQFVIATTIAFIARMIAERRPHAMDRIFGPAYRRGEVRFALVAQLLPLVNGGARLYEEIAGVTVPDVDRVARLGLVVFMMAGVWFGFFRFSRNAGGRSNNGQARAASRGAVALLFAVATMAWSSSSFAQDRSILPADAEIRRILMDRVETHRQTLGIVVGIVEPSGTRIVAHGVRTPGGAAVDGDTVFELASVTKAFTSLLLADAVVRGEVAFDDPVGKYLPAEVVVPSRGGRQITLLDLSTHMSGLPREPSNLRPKDPTNPFADYTVAQLYEFLSTHQLTRDVGAEYDYSNLGAALLGHALARRAGTDYGTLVRTRITTPLRMTDTDVAFSPAMRSRLAIGHSRGLEPTPNWDSPTLAGAGALRSTANDMLRFLSAAVGLDSTLGAAFTAALTTRRPTASPAFTIGLGWGVLTDRGTTIAFANGRSGGYRTWVGLDPARRIGIVILTNTDSASGPDDIGMHLLNPAFPLQQTFAPPPAQRNETAIDPRSFDRFVGRYQFAPAVHLTVTRAENRFFGELTGQPPFEMFAEGPTRFFLKAVDAQLTFEADASGAATAVILHQGGRDQRAPRVVGDAVMPKEVALAPDVLDRYVGRYQIGPGVFLTITRQGTRLFAAVPGSPPLEAFASGERDFFHKDVDVQLTFEPDGRNRATAVIIRQNGASQRIVRAE